MTFGGLAKRRDAEGLFRSWIHPLRHNPKIRRDLTKYLGKVSKPQMPVAAVEYPGVLTGTEAPIPNSSPLVSSRCSHRSKPYLKF